VDNNASSLEPTAYTKEKNVQPLKDRERRRRKEVRLESYHDLWRYKERNSNIGGLDRRDGM
jgi:hypothetical protein